MKALLVAAALCAVFFVLYGCTAAEPRPAQAAPVLNERALRDGRVGLSVSRELFELEQRLLEQEERMRKGMKL